MLSLYEFNLLPKQQQYAYIWDRCTFVTHRMESQTVRVNLYHSAKGKEEFWIEVYYNSEYNELEKVASFKARRLLEPYWNMINIGDALPPAT